MKTPKLLLTGTLGIALAGFVLTGCQKDSSSSPSSTDTDVSAAQDEANGSAAMNDSKNVTDASMQGSSNKYGPAHSVQSIYSIHCVVTWSRDTTSGDDTMYVNFGPTPVLCNDGRYRQGEILVYGSVASGSTLRHTYMDSGSAITMTFRTYAAGNSSTNLITITGTRIWTNTGPNALAEENWSFNANLTLKYADGKSASWVSNRTNSLVPVGGVYYYEITGSGSGVSKSGAAYTVTITSPLYVTAYPWWTPQGCRWIESGVINITRPASGKSLSIDYGSIGTCDNQATATLNGVSYPITLL